MKKILLFVCMAALSLSAYATRDLQTVSWSFKDSSAICSKLLGPNSTGGVFDTIVKPESQYVIRFVHPKDGAGYNNTGFYFHNSSSGKGDNYIELYVPARTKGVLKMKWYLTATNNFSFYTNVLAETAAVPANLYNGKHASTVKQQDLSVTSKGTKTLNNMSLDMTDSLSTQVIRIFYTGSTGGRLVSLEWQEIFIAEDEPEQDQFAYWDMIGDSTNTCAEYQNQVKLAAYDTLTSDFGTKLFFLSSYPEGANLSPKAKDGLYWHRSNEHTRAIVLTSEGGKFAEITMRLRPGKKNAPYLLYAFAEDASKPMPKYHNQLSSALLCQAWTYNKYEGKDVKIGVDLRNKVGAQNIYILLVDENNTDGARICSVKYEESLGTKLDFIGDSTETCNAYLDELTFIAQTAITKNGITYKYNRGLGLSKDNGDKRGQGAYWKLSNDADGDKALILTVPGNSLGTIQLGLRPGSDTATYNFYVFAKPASESYTANDLNQHLDEAIYSTTWSFNEFTEDILSLPVDLTQKNEAQKLYVIFTHCNGKNNRLRWIDYSYTSQYTVNETSNGLAGVDNKLKVNVQLSRSTLISASYNTICLPFSLTKAQVKALFGDGYSLLQYVGSDLYEDKLDLKFEETKAIEEGVPYLIKPAADVTLNAENIQVVTTGSTAAQTIEDPQGRANFVGTYEPFAMTANDETNWFMGPSNTIHFPNASASMPGLRAYFAMLQPMQNVQARMVINQSTIVTGIEQTAVKETTADKMLINGRIMILRNGRSYDMMGNQY